MKKEALINYLEQKFEFIIVNDKFKHPIDVERTKYQLDILANTLDDACFIQVADIICKNKKGEYFYFIYYGKVGSILIYDTQKKCINIKMSNNVMKRYQYENVLKKIKKDIKKSHSYLIFFANCDVEFNEPKSSHILILNEQNLDEYLMNKYDY